MTPTMTQGVPRTVTASGAAYIFQSIDSAQVLRFSRYRPETELRQLLHPGRRSYKSTLLVPARRPSRAGATPSHDQLNDGDGTLTLAIRADRLPRRDATSSGPRATSSKPETPSSLFLTVGKFLRKLSGPDGLTPLVS